MLAWSEGTDNGRQKTRNHGYDVIVGGELFTDYLITLANPVTLNPKLKSTGAGRYQFLSRWWDVTGQLGLKDSLSEKSGRCGIALAMWRLPHWSWWYPSGNRPLQQYLGLLPGAGYGQFGAVSADTDCKIQRSGRGTVREIDVWAESPRLYLRSGYSSSPACHGLLINNDNAITYKAQRDKTEHLVITRGGNYWHADASVTCCARCKIHEGVSWC